MIYVLTTLPIQISFGVAPATAAFALGLRTPLDTLALAFFVLCGLTRLARFNVTVAALPKDATGKSKYFEGAPIPTSLCIVAAMALAIRSGMVVGGSAAVAGGNSSSDPVVGGVMLGDWFGGGVHPVVLVFAAWGCALVSKTIHIPKP